MNKFAALFLLCLGIFTLNGAHIGFLMPSGGQQGTSVDIIVGGQAFWAVKSAVVSGGGVEVESIQVVRGLPLPDGKQRRYINNVLKNFHTGKPTDLPKPEDSESWRKHDYYDRLDKLSPCERDILYRFLFVPRNSLQASPAIASRIIIRLKIAADAAPGEREFRLLERNGRLSNPLKFFVGKAAEFREEFFPFPPAKQNPVAFTIPGTLNGQIMPGEVDKFTFSMKKGEIVTFKLFGRHLNPFIGDGVPGHFQAVLEVVDKNRKSLAFADDYFFDPDPVLTFQAPADDEYTLLIRDAIYRGRADFVYRVTAQAGEPLLPDAQAPVIPGVPVKDQTQLSPDTPVEYPVMIKGAITPDKSNDYLIKLQKDERVILELFSRRMGLPPDGVIKVFDEKGRLLTFNDDTERLKAGLILHNSADPLVIFTAPEDGIYRVNVSDNAGFAGKAYKYFLRIDREERIFSVYSVPSTKLISADSCTAVKVIADRSSGYQGEIKIKVVSPEGIRIAGIDSIPAGVNSAFITLEGKFERNRPLYDLKLEASAGNFKTPVIPGDEAMQAFAYTHINPAKTFPVRVQSRTTPAKWENKALSFTVEPGKTIKLRTQSVPFYQNVSGEVKLVAENLPPFLKVVPQKNSSLPLKEVTLRNKRIQRYLPALEIELQATADGAGKAENLLFYIRWEYVSKPDKNGKTRKVRQQILLPAIRVNISGK